ncbi:hypothetical protein ACR777_05330 [Sphingobacterium spiritivorum]|uniref:hypothetical protein n=1 Tax=Sphingobacterium spiritivorum TaxID=258 RepID=UPI003DA363DC
MGYVKDILLNDDFDLLIENGDFVYGESDEQHLQLIALLEPGQLRYSPLTGLSLFQRLQSPLNKIQQDRLRKDVYEQVEFDGYRPGTSSISFDGDIEIKADR